MLTAEGRTKSKRSDQVTSCFGSPRGSWFMDRMAALLRIFPHSPITRRIGISLRRHSHHPNPHEHEKPEHADAMGKKDQSSDCHDDPT
jgi:hypothetical protein